MTKAQIKSTGKIVEVTSRFMPKKRNVPSREWMCNLSDGTCINEGELEYLKDSLQDELDKEASEYADKHYSEWEEHWDDYNGYNTEPENDKLQLTDAFKAGAQWIEKKDIMEMVMSNGSYFQKCYEQGKKDNELTIKDLELLHTFLCAVKNNKQGAFTFTRLSDEQYNEVLRKFKEAKKWTKN